MKRKYCLFKIRTRFILRMKFAISCFIKRNKTRFIKQVLLNIRLIKHMFNKIRSELVIQMTFINVYEILSFCMLHILHATYFLRISKCMYTYKSLLLSQLH